jgi:hypothetical protein
MRTLERFATAERMEAITARIYRLVAQQHESDPVLREPGEPGPPARQVAQGGLSQALRFRIP